MSALELFKEEARKRTQYTVYVSATPSIEAELILKVIDRMLAAQKTRTDSTISQAAQDVRHPKPCE